MKLLKLLKELKNTTNYKFQFFKYNLTQLVME